MRNKETLVIKKIAVILVNPKRRGHTTPWGPHRKNWGGQEVEGEGETFKDSKRIYQRTAFAREFP